MKGADFIAIIILAAIVIAVCAYLLHWLYRRSTKDISFVRTGFGGEKVVMGGGARVCRDRARRGCRRPRRGSRCRTATSGARHGADEPA